ncbi:MAG TPA: tetratricopeptide repeat protein [Polyangium sp.]|nr:tetratricopeptide repeat protein [Polyangium sp.]
MVRRASVRAENEGVSRSSALKPVVLDIDRNGRIDILRESLAEDIGFSLVFLHAPPGPVREELLQRFRGWSGKDGVPQLVEVHLAPGEWPHERLHDLGLDNVDRAMVVLTGIEQYAIGPKVSHALARFNFVRDLLPDWIPGTLIIIASDDAFLTLRESAPDTMTWRSFEWTINAIEELRNEFGPLPKAPEPVSPGGFVEIAEMSQLLQSVLKRPHGAYEEALVRLRLGRALVQAYRHDEGEAELTYAAQVFSRDGRIAKEAEAVFWLGDNAFRRSDYETATQHYLKALRLYEKVNDTLGEAHCIRKLGDVAFNCSDNETAQSRYEQAMLIYRQIKDPEGEANCVEGLGDVALRRCDYDRANRNYLDALALHEKAGNSHGAANCFQSLGELALQVSDHESAKARFEQALGLYEKTGDLLGKANCVYSLGNIAFARSDDEMARLKYDEALIQYKKIGEMLGEANCLWRLGWMALSQNPDQARVHFESAQSLYRTVGNVLGQANCIQGLGDLAYQNHEYTTARTLYRDALPLYAKMGDLRGEANCLKSLGDIAGATNEPNVAQSLFDRALKLYERFGDPYSIGWTHQRLAQLAPTPDLRAHHLDAARQAWKRIGREDLIAKNLDSLS